MVTKREKELEKELRQTRKHRSFWVNIGLLDDVRTAVEAGLLKDPTSGATLKSFSQDPFRGDALKDGGWYVDLSREVDQLVAMNSFIEGGVEGDSQSGFVGFNAEAGEFVIGFSRRFSWLGVVSGVGVSMWMLGRLTASVRGDLVRASIPWSVQAAGIWPYALLLLLTFFLVRHGRCVNTFVPFFILLSLCLMRCAFDGPGTFYFAHGAPLP